MYFIIDRYESRHIKEITNIVFRRLNHKKLVVDTNLVDMDPRVEKTVLQLHMESDDVRVIGISGIGGIGKTTIAKVLYNQLSCEFEYMSFIENVKENIETRGFIYLQTQLLCDILEEGENQNISSVGQGASMIKKILQSKRVLIILDDVDDSDQLEYLVGNRCWLGKGSRVIITTRYKHLLTVQEVDDSYEVEELDFEQSHNLLIWHAFKNSPPMQKYMDLLDRLLCYCEGLPLALKVLGSLLIKKAYLNGKGNWINGKENLNRRSTWCLKQALMI